MPVRISGTQGDPHAGRSENVRVIALTLDVEAYELLPELAPNRKAYGQYISRLIHEHKARVEERNRLKAEQAQLS